MQQSSPAPSTGVSPAHWFSRDILVSLPNYWDLSSTTTCMSSLRYHLLELFSASMNETHWTTFLWLLAIFELSSTSGLFSVRLMLLAADGCTIGALGCLVYA